MRFSVLLLDPVKICGTLWKLMYFIWYRRLFNFTDTYMYCTKGLLIFELKVKNMFILPTWPMHLKVTTTQVERKHLMSPSMRFYEVP